EQLRPYGLFMVAEDVGGTHGGKASRRAVEVIAEQIAPSLANDRGLGSEQLATLLKLAIIRASLDLRQQCLHGARDLGVAVTGVMILGEGVYVVNVGHCRTYIFRPGVGLRQVTTDHSVVSCLIENGLLEPEALYTHPRRDQIYRSVGDSQAPTAEVDTFEVSAHPDDLFLPCSPGLWQALRQSQIEAILRAEADPQHAAEALARAGASRVGVGAFNVIVVRPLREWMPAFGMPAGQVDLPP